MSGSLPADRLPIRHRAVLAPALFGAFCVVGGGGVVTGTGVVLDHGWVGAIPDPLQQAAGVLAILIGLACILPCLLWMLVPWRGPRPPVVHFESTRIVIRKPLPPKTLVVERDAIVGVDVVQIQEWGQDWGLWPLVAISRDRGRGLSIQNIYEGDPRELAGDIARWASVPLGASRRTFLGEEERFEGPDP